MNHGSLGHIVHSGEYNANYLWREGGATGVVAPASNPNVYFPLTNANDVCAGAHNLNNTHGSPSFPSGGVKGNYCQFTSAGDYIYQTTPFLGFEPVPSQPWSASLWVNFSSIAASSGFFGSNSIESNNNGSTLILNSNGTLTAYIAGQTPAVGKTSSLSYQYTCNGGALTSSTWYHVVLVLNLVSNNLKMYVNNSLVSTSSTIVANWVAVKSNFGFIGCPQSQPVNFKIDEVGLWTNYALTTSDISNLYNGGAGLTFDGTTWS